MEIELFSKCIRELIVENDRVDVPYLGTFTAEMVPASYSDRQTTINPPYRKMAFRKGEVSLAEGRMLLDKVRRELDISLDQAGVELGWCLSRLCSELEGSKSCRLPGLGVMRANARNEFFFVPDDDLDIWPDGLGFEPISIKVSEKEEIPDQVRNDDPSVRNDEPVVRDDDAVFRKDETEVRNDEAVVRDDKPVVRDGETVVRDGERDGRDGERGGRGDGVVVIPGLTRNLEGQVPAAKPKTGSVAEPHRPRRPLKPVWIVVIVLAALLALFVAACYLFTDQLSPVIDRLLYTREELELLGR